MMLCQSVKGKKNSLREHWLVAFDEKVHVFAPLFASDISTSLSSHARQGFGMSSLENVLKLLLDDKKNKRLAVVATLSPAFPHDGFCVLGTWLVCPIFLFNQF